MSFDQDPSEQANISGADLAMLVDELEAAEQEIAQLKAENLSMFNTINAMHDALHQAKREYAELANKALELATTVERMMKGAT